MESYEGKRVSDETKGGLPRGAKIAIGVVGGILVLLFIAYLILCGVVSGGGKLFPNTTAAGVDVSGLTVTEAADRVKAAYNERYAGFSVPISVGDHVLTLEGKDAGAWVDATDAVERVRMAQSGEFFFAGGRYLASLTGQSWETGDYTVRLDPGKAEYRESFAREAVELIGQPMAESSWAVDERGEAPVLILQRGVTGYTVVGLTERIEYALENRDSSPIQAQIVVAEPAEVDFDAIAREVFREPEDAKVDPESYEVVAHRVGLSLNVAQAKRQFAALGEGELCRVPLVVKEPEMTAEKLGELLFRDILGEATTPVSGTIDRNTNIRLAAEFCNGKILLPGEQMSYNDTIMCDAEHGYQMGDAYVDGRSVPTLGGGICQVSSTLYYACLLSNLKIVERHQHMYAVGYIPDGVDATVYGGLLDYIFENDTQYPIKIETSYVNQYLTVRIYGTKVDGNYVEMECNRLATYDYGVVYEPNESVPQGTTWVKQTAYIGRRVESYRCVYNEDGELLSRTLESMNTYKSRDRIIQYNPEDGDPSQPKPEPEPETPEEPPAPPEEEAPSSAEETPPPETPPEETPTEEPGRPAGNDDPPPGIPMD